MRLGGRHAVVTGGGGGIGAAVARALAAEGARISLIGRRREPLEAVAAELAGQAIVADVTDRAQVDAAFATARAAYGPISILVNNAGSVTSAPFARVTDELWRQTLAVNLDALLHCTQSALADLQAEDAGRVVTIASSSGLKGYGYVAPYVAAKHGAVGLTRALAAEFAKTRMTVNAVCPGFTDTDIAAQAMTTLRTKTGRSEDQALAELIRFNPQARLVDPAEVASVVLWLCLPDSRSITGQAIAVNGGETM